MTTRFDVFCRPCRGWLVWSHFPPGSRPGLISIAPTALRAATGCL